MAQKVEEIKVFVTACPECKGKMVLDKKPVNQIEVACGSCGAIVKISGAAAVESK